jgi:hypothetical protein
MSERQIIGLCGYAGSGKDTAAAGLVAEGWTRVAFADGVREALLALNPEISMAHLSSYLVHWGGWDEAKRQIPEIRTLLQRMGTEVGRAFFGDDCWINIARRKIKDINGNVVITDVRFENEADAIYAMGGEVFRIERPGVGPKNDHASEKLEFFVNRTISNDGTTQELQDRLRQFVALEVV